MNKTKNDPDAEAPRTKTTILTRREKEIIELLALGKTNKEIAKILFISSETVKSHIKNLFIKTNTCSRTALIAKYLSSSSILTAESPRFNQIREN